MADPDITPPPEAIKEADEAKIREAVETAKKILTGQEKRTPEEILAIVKTLKEKQQYFRYARRILESALAEVQIPSPLALKIGQEFSLATYKDQSLPTDERLERALKILERVDPLATSTSAETLGQAGAIHKLRWMLDSQKVHLERSLVYYRRGGALGPATPGGAPKDSAWKYPAINAAFVLDLLAGTEEKTARETHAGADAPEFAHVRLRRKEAARIRESIVSALIKSGKAGEDEWVAATLAEAYFGLEKYEDARKAMAEFKGSDWKFQTTARQMAWLANLQQQAHSWPSLRDSGAWPVLEMFFPTPEQPAAGETPEPQEASTAARSAARDLALRSLLQGRIGLALSGGGFRASLFHIGVLARLAELDLLRHVEAISCVSGGSIIGAHYYLELAHLLRSQRDHEITRADYIGIVQRLETDFLAGVQENPRISVAVDGEKNRAQLRDEDYSRTDRLGELYDEQLFARVKDGGDWEKRDEKRRFMHELIVRPAGWQGDFSPATHNWQRAAKVPQLILNATTVNTGHIWQFTATWMGEPAAPIDRRIDANERLRRMWYGEAPEKFREFPLGRAVAASSCVPALFEPIVLRGLYEAAGEEGASLPRVVRLVDGGVNDNQGIASLLEQECATILVSDASGEIPATFDPSTEVWSVYPRVNDLLMARVRASQYADLRQRQRALLLRGLMFLHLKKDLDVWPVDWKGCDDPANAGRTPPNPRTSYKIAKDVQALLASLRTDLDAFSDAEAFALMHSGYAMAVEDAAAAVPTLADVSSPPADWHFGKIKGATTGTKPEEHQRLKKYLKVGVDLAFKIWKLDPQLKSMGGRIQLLIKFAGLVAVLLALGWLVVVPSPWRWLPLWMAGALLVAIIGLVWSAARGWPAKTRAEVLIGLFLRFGGARVARKHLAVYNQRFLKIGAVPGNRVDATP